MVHLYRTNVFIGIEITMTGNHIKHDLTRGNKMDFAQLPCQDGNQRIFIMHKWHMRLDADPFQDDNTISGVLKILGKKIL